MATINKYHARKTASAICNRVFDSAAEARRGEALRLMELAGQISNLEYQIPFKLCDKPKITITIDFRYLQDGEIIFEDVKGILLRDSRTKFAWLKEKHGIDVRITQ